MNGSRGSDGPRKPEKPNGAISLLTKFHLSDFTLYAVGISVWMILVSCSGSTYMLPLLPPEANVEAYVIPKQGAYVALFFVAALIEWKRRPIGQHAFERITLGSFVIAIVCIAALYFGLEVSALLVAYGMSMGVGIAAGFMQWIRIVAERPTREIELLLFIASGFSIVSGIVFCFVPFEWRILIFAIALVPATIVLLHLNTKSLRVAGNKAAPANIEGGSRRLFSSLAVPIICAIVLTLVAPIASTTYIDTTGQDLFRTLLAQIANAVALAVLAVIYLGMNRKVSMFNAYCMLLPVLASSVLIASFFEPSQRWFVLFLGDVCFCTVSFLMMLTCCSISKQLNTSAIVVYGLFGGFVYLARIPEILLVTTTAHPLDALAPFAITALLLYLLTIPTFFLPFLRKQSNKVWNAKEALTVSDLAQACENIAERYSLPKRQLEVLTLLVGGHSIPHISEALFLSSNTVKTYRKAIYATVNVHSKQELLDLVYDELRREETSPQL